MSDSESYGFGVRTLVNGSWGFAATSVMTRAGAQAAALEAVVMSRAARAVQNRPVELAPVKPVTGTWITPVTRDPLDVPLEDKIALLLATNEAALKVANVRFVNTSLAAASRGEDAGDVRRHERHADDDPRRPVLLGHRDRQRRLSKLRRGAGAARLGLGVRRVAEHAWQCRAMGVAGRREAEGEERRSRPVRSDSRADQSVADDSRVDRPSHRARSRDRRRSELRRARVSSRRRRKTSASCSTVRRS